MRLFVAAVLTAALCVPALAADPESGTISPANPKVTWTGHIEASSIGYAFFTTLGESPSGQCQELYCDTYTLTLGGDGPGNVTLIAHSDQEGVNEIDIALEKPDGTVTVYSGEDTAKGTAKGLAPGTYPLYVWGVRGLSSGGIAFDYDGSAELGTAAIPAAPPNPGQSPTQPHPSPQPVTSPGQQSSQPAKLTLRPGKQSARKVNRSRTMTIKVSSSQPVKNLQVLLKRGKKTVGSAKVAGFEGSGTLAVRLSRKLKRGRHVLSATATDNGGRTVTATKKFKIRK